MDKVQKVTINNFSYGFLYCYTGTLIYLETFGFSGNFIRILELIIYAFLWLPMLISEIVIKYGFLQ